MIKAQKMRGAMPVALVGEKKNLCNISVRKRDGQRPLGRSRHR
jgi:hypothetical protein